MTLYDFELVRRQREAHARGSVEAGGCPDCGGTEWQTVPGKTSMQMLRCLRCGESFLLETVTDDLPRG